MAQLPYDALPGEVHRGPDGIWYQLQWVELPGQHGAQPVRDTDRSATLGTVFIRLPQARRAG